MKALFFIVVVLLVGCVSDSSQPSTSLKKRCFEDANHPGQYECYDWVNLGKK
jgi:hypothetical protein